MKSSLLLLLSVSFFNSFNRAQADLGDANPFFGEAIYGGTGCPGGTASRMPGEGSVAFQLDEFRLNLENGGRASFDRKACTIAIQLHVPKGMRIGFNVPKITGIADLSNGASLNLTFSAFLSGGDSIRESRSLTGTYSGDLMAAEESTQVLFTQCGKDHVLNVSVSSLLRNAGESEHAFASIDTIELGQMQLQQCN